MSNPTPQSSIAIEYRSHGDTFVNFDMVTTLEGEEVERRAVSARRDQSDAPAGYIEIVIANLDVPLSTEMPGYDSIEHYVELN